MTPRPLARSRGVRKRTGWHRWRPAGRAAPQHWKHPAAGRPTLGTPAANEVAHVSSSLCLSLPARSIAPCHRYFSYLSFRVDARTFTIGGFYDGASVYVDAFLIKLPILDQGLDSDKTFVASRNLRLTN